MSDETPSSPSPVLAQEWGNPAALYRLLVENVEEYAIFTLDTQSQIISWNAGVRRILGYEEAEFIGQNGAIIFNREDQARGAPEQELKTATERGNAVDERWHIKKNGTLFWSSGMMIALREPDGTLRGFVKILRDFTRQKEWETALRLRDAHLKVALEAAQAATWEFDPHTGDGYWSDSYWSLLGLERSRDAATIANWLKPVHPDDQEYAASLFREGLRQRRDFAGEYRVIHPDGSIRWLLTIGRPLPDPLLAEEAPPLILVGVTMDITERKEVEEALRRANEMLEARVEQRTADLREETRERQRLLERLVQAQEEERRRISRELHDHMGQYLTAFTLGLQALQEAVVGDRNTAPVPAATPHLTRMQRLADAMDRDVHRLAAELVPTALEDLGLVRTLETHLEEWSARTGVAVGLEAVGLEPEKPLPPGMNIIIYRVVQEALNNVARHARATQVSVVIEQQEREVRAVIEDNGVGFAREERGSSASSASGDRERASRLGLIGMRERAALAGGTLEIESAVGQGTAVHLRLPLPPHHPE